MLIEMQFKIKLTGHSYGTTFKFKLTGDSYGIIKTNQSVISQTEHIVKWKYGLCLIGQHNRVGQFQLPLIKAIGFNRPGFY